MSNKKLLIIIFGLLAAFLGSQKGCLLAMHSLQEISFQRIIKTICDAKLDEEILSSLRDENFNNGLDAFLNFNRPDFSTNLQNFLPIFNQAIQCHSLAQESFPRNFDQSDKIHSIIQLKKGPLRYHLVSASHKNNIKIWNPFTKECVNILEGHTNAVTSVIEINYNNIWCIASASQDETVRIWDLPTGECIAILNISDAYKIIQLNNGNLVSVGSTIKIWDLTTARCVGTLDGHTNKISSIIELDIANLIATSSYDDTVKIWDLDRFTCVQSLQDKDPVERHWLFSVTQLNNGYIAAGSSDGSLKIWNPFTGECAERLEGHNAMVISVIQLANGDLISGDCDGYIKIWHKSAHKEYEFSHTLKSQTSGIPSLLQMHDGNLVSGSWNRTIDIWDLYPSDTQRLSLKQYHLISNLDNPFKNYKRVKLHPDWLEVFQSLPERYQLMFNETIHIPNEELFCFGLKRKTRHDDDDFPFPDNKKFEQS